MISNRNVKDSGFTAYFSAPENASKLSAALGDEAAPLEGILYVTLEGAVHCQEE